MKAPWNRRQLLKSLAATSASLTLPRGATGLNALLQESNSEQEIQITSISEHTVKLSVLPIANGKTAPIPLDGSLVQTSWGEPLARLRGKQAPHELKAGGLGVHVSANPIAFTISTLKGSRIQQLEVDPAGSVSFATGNSLLLGLGEGGPQFDRRGSTDAMVSGQGGYRLRTHGGRVPIPWIISTGGWAMFFHQPFGTFDFTGPQSKFHPSSPGAPRHFLCALPRPSGHHGRVRADYRSRGNATAVELRISAVPSHSRQP